MRVFYRQYRPQKFSDLVGQETLAKTLLSQLEAGKFGHGYLFYGPKGTGKTSTARIFAKAVNCLGYRSEVIDHRKKLKTQDSRLKTAVQQHGFGEPCNRCQSCISIVDGSNLDLIEIDAASNRGIDEIRDLREKIKLSPVSSRFKVYIIDEAHMLTSEAFNALLKTLEEPPAHAVFILCTTEVGKLPQTIISRLQKFNFSRAKKDDLVKVILKIAKSEQIKIESSTAGEIADVSDGSYRDAVSIFDQVSAGKKVVKADDVVEIARAGGWDQLFNFTTFLANKKIKEAVLLLEEMTANGADVSFFARQTVLFLEKLLFIKIGIFDTMDGDYSGEQTEKMKTLCAKFEQRELQDLMKQFLVAESETKLYPLPQIPLILVVCKLALGEQETLRRSSGLAGNPSMTLTTSKELQTPENNAIETTTQLIHGNGKKSAKSLAAIEKNWDKFLNKVKPINAHVVALLKSTRPLELDGPSLKIEVFYRFHKEKLEEPKIINMLDEVMSEVANLRVKLNFVLSDRSNKVPRVVSRSNVVDIKSEDLEKAAQEIFSK